MNRCGHDHHAIAGYVLDGLSEDEARDVAAWIDECSDCRAEYEHLAPLVRLLDLARRDPTPAPARIRDRIVADAVRRRLRTRFVAAACAVALVAGLAGLAIGRQSLEPAPVSLPLYASEPFEVHGTITYRTEGGRLVVDVVLDGIEALEEPAVYEAWLYGIDDRIVSIGQLEPVEGRIEAELVAPAGASAFATFWITAEPDKRDPAHDGPTVARASVPRWTR